jgi:hypothetical protein
VSKKANPQEVIGLILKTLNDHSLVIKHKDQIDNLLAVRFSLDSLDEKPYFQDSSLPKTLSNHDSYHVLFSKIERSEEGWLCEYKLYFSTKKYEDHEKVMESVWSDLLNANSDLNLFAIN